MSSRPQHGVIGNLMNVREVVRLVNEPRTSVERLAAAVEKHEALTKSVLRKANSPSFGYSGRRIHNLKFAVVVLGLDAVKETLRSLLATQSGQKLTSAVTQHKGLWEHSIGCAIAARTLARASGKCSPDDAFMAGLLHDVGMLFANSIPMESDRSDSPEKGKKAHADLGAQLVERWGLPADVVEAIRFHHTPNLAPGDPSLAMVVHLAEFLSHRLQVGVSPLEYADHYDADILAQLELPGNPSIDQVIGAFAAPLPDRVEATQSFGELVKQVRLDAMHAFRKLREEQRMIVVLHYYEGLSTAEIAQVFGMPALTAGMQLSSAVAQLKEALQRTFEWRYTSI